MFIDQPLLHLPTLFFSIKFLKESIGSGSRDDNSVCAEGLCSALEGSSFYLPLDSIDSSVSMSRKLTLSIEQELKDPSSGGIATVEPLYSFVYNTNWDGRGVGVGAADDEWVKISSGGQQPRVPVGKAQDLPIAIRVEELMAMAQWPQLMTIGRGSITGPEVKLFYLLEFDVRVGGGDRAASPDGPSIEHVILSLELHACVHADWRSPWSSSSSSATEQVHQSALDGMEAAALPAAGLPHVEGAAVEGAEGEGQWSHYKCSAGKQWFDDAEVGSASSSGMHAESARHINRSQPRSHRLLSARRVTRDRRVCMFSALCMTSQGAQCASDILASLNSNAEQSIVTFVQE
jgi:hypothetical protein